MRQLLKLAAAVGAIGCIMVPLFNRDPRVLSLEPYASTEQLQRDLLVTIMRPLAQEAADLGVCILIEPLIRYESNFPQDLAEAASICDEVDSPGLKLMADFFHMNVGGSRHRGQSHRGRAARAPYPPRRQQPPGPRTWAYRFRQRLPCPTQHRLCGLWRLGMQCRRATRPNAPGDRPLPTGLPQATGLAPLGGTVGGSCLTIQHPGQIEAHNADLFEVSALAIAIEAEDRPIAGHGQVGVPGRSWLDQP